METISMEMAIRLWKNGLSVNSKKRFISGLAPARAMSFDEFVKDDYDNEIWDVSIAAPTFTEMLSVLPKVVNMGEDSAFFTFDTAAGGYRSLYVPKEKSKDDNSDIYDLWEFELDSKGDVSGIISYNNPCDSLVGILIVLLKMGALPSSIIKKVVKGLPMNDVDLGGYYFDGTKDKGSRDAIVN